MQAPSFKRTKIHSVNFSSVIGILGCKKNGSSPQENKYELAHEFSGSNPCTYFNSNIDNSSELIEPLVSKKIMKNTKKD